MPSTSHTPDSDAATASGTLYVVATPIGNMDDITLRAITVLTQVALVAAEDTRNTQRLFSHHHISTPLISYHEHNEQKRAVELVNRLLKGEQIALVSDAGTPTVSDPGYRLVVSALAHHVPVIPIPGVSAVTASLSVAGFPTDSFVFEGFLDKKKSRREKQLDALSRDPRTLVFYESPKRIKDLLGEILEVMGDRRVVLAREMTKVWEEYLRGSASEVLSALSVRDQVKGECTLLVAGAPAQTDISMDMVRQEICEEMESTGDGIGRISRRIADKYGLSRQAVYAEGLKEIKNMQGRS